MFGIPGRVDGLGLREQLLHFVPQLLLLLPHPAVAHRLVAQRIQFVAGRQHVARHILDQAALNLARRKPANTVAYTKTFVSITG